VERLLNPTMLVAMMIAGIVYGLVFLWALNIRDSVRLYAIAVGPGLVFLSLVLGVRAAQGINTTAYQLIIVNWLLFSNVAFVALIVSRRLTDGHK
jgi:hypothetical protein